MTGDLYTEIAARYHDLHREDARSGTEADRHAAFALESLRARVLALIADGVPPDVIESALFRYWLRVATWNHRVPDGRFEALAADARSLAESLFDVLERTAASIVDDGPTVEMRVLGLLIDDAKAECDALPRPPAARRRVAARKKKEALDAFARFLDECVVRLVHPRLIESVLLYCWLRTYVTTIGAIEEFFQRLDRHWPEVLERVDAFVKSRFATRSSEPAGVM